MSYSVAQIASHISNVVRVDQSAIQSDAFEAVEQGLSIAFAYKGHRCNTDPLRKALEKMQAVKSAKSRALQPVLTHFISQADSIRLNAKNGEAIDVPALVTEGVEYFKNALVAFEAMQAEKSKVSSAKASETKLAKAEAQAIKVEKELALKLESAKAEAVESAANDLASAQAEVIRLRSIIETIANAKSLKEVKLLAVC